MVCLFATPKIFVLESQKDHGTHHIRWRIFATPKIFVLESQKDHGTHHIWRSVFLCRQRPWYTSHLEENLCDPEDLRTRIPKEHITSGGELLRPRRSSYSNPKRIMVHPEKYLEVCLFMSPKIMLHITSGGWRIHRT